MKNLRYTIALVLISLFNHAKSQETSLKQLDNGDVLYISKDDQGFYKPNVVIPSGYDLKIEEIEKKISKIQNYVKADHKLSAYTLQDDDVAISSGGIITTCEYDDDEYTDITIPETLQGITVKGLGVGVMHNKGITSINFPSTIEYLGEQCLSWNSITSIDFSTIPNLSYIGYYALHFNNISSLDLSPCDALITLSPGAFSNNYNLNSLILGNSITFLGRQCFFACNLNSVTLGNNILTMEDAVFNWNNITEVNGNPSNGLFYKLENGQVDSTEITSYGNGIGNQNIDFIPSDVETIGDGCFYNSNISTIDFSNLGNLTVIDTGSFCYTNITDLDFTGCSNLEEILYGAFSPLYPLETVNFEPLKRLRKIEKWAFGFHRCTEIIDLTYCTGMEIIDEWAFATEDELFNFNGMYLPIPEKDSQRFIHWEADDGGDISYLEGGEFTDLEFAEFTAIFEPFGVSTVQSNEISIYPNPSNGQLNFTLEENAEIKVMDITGKEIKNIKANSGQFKLELTDVPKGIYLVEVRAKVKSEVTKIIIR